MVEYEIRVLARSHCNFDRLSIDFYDQFDGVLAAREGMLHVTVNLEASDAIAAARAALFRLRTIGLQAVRLDPDLVDATEAARRLNRTRQSVQQLAAGTRGADFPPPIAVIGSKRVWRWDDLANWARTNLSDFDEPSGLTADEAAIVDADLAAPRLGPAVHSGPGTVRTRPGLQNTADAWPQRYRRRRPTLMRSSVD